MSFQKFAPSGQNIAFTQSVDAATLQANATIPLNIPEGNYIFNNVTLQYLNGTIPYNYGGDSPFIVGNSSGVRFCRGNGFTGAQPLNSISFMFPLATFQTRSIANYKETFTLGFTAAPIAGDEDLIISISLTKIL